MHNQIIWQLSQLSQQSNSLKNTFRSESDRIELPAFAGFATQNLNSQDGNQKIAK